MTVFDTTQAQFSDAAKELEGGRRFRDQGIYLFRSILNDERGTNLGLYYHFAAPHNLYTSQTFINTSAILGNHRDWHGHNGFKIHNPYQYERELMEGYRNGSADGKWIIPSAEMVKKLWMHLDAPDVKDTLTLQGNAASALHFCRHAHPHDANFVHIVNVVEAVGKWGAKQSELASCRPCRSVRVDHLRL